MFAAAFKPYTVLLLCSAGTFKSTCERKIVEQRGDMFTVLRYTPLLFIFIYFLYKGHIFNNHKT